MFKKQIKIISVLVFLGLVVIFCVTANSTNLFHNKPIIRSPGKPLSRVDNNKNITTNESKKHLVTPSASLNNGYVVDMKGKFPAGQNTPETKEWSSSASRAIILKIPTEASNFKINSYVYGSSRLSPVGYRIIDNKVGVVAEGLISVADGSFSGKVVYKSQSDSGRLDLYNIDSSGKEINGVQVHIKL